MIASPHRTLPQYDVAVIGGGVNGAAIVRDLAGRGYRCILFEQGDLGSATSSASSKMIHGGLRYLEQYDFSLVARALSEREVIWRAAPHIVWPLRFLLPQEPHSRPAWMLRAGLMLYDSLGGRVALPPHSHHCLRALGLHEHVKTARTAFAYTDCWVDDARLVVLLAMDAAARGAVICPRTRVTALHAGDTGYVVEATSIDKHTHVHTSVDAGVHTSVLINATGGWAADTAALATPLVGQMRLVQGSHVVVPALYPGDACFTLQNPDMRVVFTIPYHGGTTLVGTTDLETDSPRGATSPEEVAYLLSTIQRVFGVAYRAEDVIWQYAGVRALYEGARRPSARAQDATREHHIERDASGRMISLLGGKITSHRTVAAEVAEVVAETLGIPAHGLGGGWTATHPLPGGDFFPDRAFVGNSKLQRRQRRLWGEQSVLLTETALLEELRSRLGENRALAPELVRRYGTRALRFCTSVRGMGTGVMGTSVLGAEVWSAETRLGRKSLHAAELVYLCREEFASTAEDILMRRTKLGIGASPEAVEELQAVIDRLEIAHRPTAPKSTDHGRIS